MANIFVISDTHFGHANILNFTDSMGQHLRTFEDVDEMNEHMIQAWNSVVSPQDKVYHLGDVALGRTDLVARCNGHKRLILGNHDRENSQVYLKYFEKLFSTRILDQLLFSHIPIHPESLGKSLANVHGHVHNNVPQGFFGPRYYNVSCEVLDYVPIELSELKARIVRRLEKFS